MSTITQFPSGNTQYRIEFDYLARTFVVVTLVNSSDPALNRVLEAGRDYRFLNPTMIEMLVDQSGFDIVRIHRQTGTDLVVDFRNGSVLTASDLTNAELQAIHIAEEGRDQTVDLAKEYADAAGSSAGNAKDSEDEARRIAADIKASGKIGYITRRSFEKGFNVTTWNEVLLWEDDGNYYRWDGTLPKNVPASSTPETSGGIGLGAWVSVGDASLRSDLASNNGSDLIIYSGRTLKEKLSDIVDIKDFGAVPGNASACTAAVKAAIAYIKTQYRGVGTIYISNSKERNTPYLFNETILLDSQGLRIIGDSRWGSNIQTTAGVDPAIEVTGSSCEVSNIYLTTAEGATGVHLKDGNNFSSDNLVIKIAAIGVLHEKGNSSWIRNFLAESCGVGYKMYPTLLSDCNGSYIHGRSYNCEIGFEMTAGSDGTKHPGMNTIHYSCEGNVIGFKETGGRYNYLNIYSESNRKVSTQGNTNANFSTIGRPNIWVAQNPDNDENVIKGSAVGFYSRGGQVYQKVSGYERNIVTQTIQTGSLSDPFAGVYVITNGTSTTYQLTLGFLPYLRPGQEVTIISRNTANGWNIRQAGGVILYGAVVDGTLFGASVAPGKADILKVTKINDTMALTEFIRGA